MKTIYSKAIELFLSENYINQTRFYLVDGELQKEIKSLSFCRCKIENSECDFCKNQKLKEKSDFEFILVNIDHVKYVKVMKKEIGFTFIVLQNNAEDLNRIQYVYDVTIAAKNNPLLLPFAKKEIPEFRKINNKFPGKISEKEYKAINIHDKEQVIDMLNKITL